MNAAAPLPELVDIAPGVQGVLEAEGTVAVTHARFPEVRFVATRESPGCWRVDLDGPRGRVTMARLLPEVEALHHAAVCAERITDTALGAL